MGGVFGIHSPDITKCRDDFFLQEETSIWSGAPLLEVLKGHSVTLGVVRCVVKGGPGCRYLNKNWIYSKETNKKRRKAGIRKT